MMERNQRKILEIKKREKKGIYIIKKINLIIIKEAKV
jgi:hypothetical protein